MNRAENAREKLFGNLRALMEDVEELVKATAEQTDNQVSSLRERILPTLESVRGTLSNGKEILSNSKQGATAAISYAEENPWAAAGIATGAAVALVCFLWSRCTR